MAIQRWKNIGLYDSSFFVLDVYSSEMTRVFEKIDQKETNCVTTTTKLFAILENDADGQVLKYITF